MPGLTKPSHWLILILVLLLLFGAKKLPDLARSIGQSMKIFKKRSRTSATTTHRLRHTASPTSPHTQGLLPPTAPLVIRLPHRLVINRTAVEAQPNRVYTRRN